MKKRQDRQMVPPRGKPSRKPEILAPAGSPATWAAAVEAGADAVYLGLKSFSARAFAANFTPSEMARVVELTHERGAKIFVAINALIKEDELPQAVRTLDSLARIKPDALIIQDLGLFKLIKEHYPEFEIHASTLMAVHNLEGLSVLAGLGFDRAVLARELTLKEIIRLTERSPLGLEVFIHGALCFSFSGLCLMSGFLGGKGSLRGACTQPCRRRYSSGKTKGFFFSPTDLDVTEYINQLRTLPISAFKIEGRMKGAEYVSRVVRAYRILLDAPESDLEYALAQADGLIEASMGRKRSSGFLGSPHPISGLAPTGATTSGMVLGKIIAAGDDGGRIRLQNPVEIGDRLRIQFKEDNTQEAFTLKKMTVKGKPLDQARSGEEVVLFLPVDLTAGDMIFKVDTGRGEKEALASPLVKALEKSGPASRESGKPSPVLKKALASLKTIGKQGAAPPKKPEIWYKIARSEDIPGLEAVKPGRIIVPVNTRNVRRIASLRRRLDNTILKIVWSLPPLNVETAALGKDLSHLLKMGFRQFMIANLGHLPLFDRTEKLPNKKINLWADWRLNCLNTRAEALLADLGLNGLTMCLENDEGNFKNILQGPGPISRLIYLFGRPPLFTSRFMPAGLKENVPVVSPKGERFRIRPEKDVFYVLAEKPIFMSPFLKYKSLPGVKGFIVDLEFDPRPLATAKEVSESISRGRPFKQASKFNYKRGLF